MPIPPDSNQNARATRLGFSEKLESTCYWFTMVSLAIATVYLAYQALINVPPPDPNELGWCATTPPWLVDCLPLFISGVCLCQAGHSFKKGIRSWKEIRVGAAFILLRGLTQWLPSLATLSHR